MLRSILLRIRRVWSTIFFIEEERSEARTSDVLLLGRDVRMTTDYCIELYVYDPLPLLLSLPTPMCMYRRVFAKVLHKVHIV